MRGWWQDRAAGRDWQAEQVSADAPDRERTLRETLRGRFNRSPLLYLLKSLWLDSAGGLARARSAAARHPPPARALGELLGDHVALSCTGCSTFRSASRAHAYDIYLVPRLLGVKVREAEFAVTCAQVNAEFLARARRDHAGASAWW